MFESMSCGVDGGKIRWKESKSAGRGGSFSDLRNQSRRVVVAKYICCAVLLMDKLTHVGDQTRVPRAIFLFCYKYFLD